MVKENMKCVSWELTRVISIRKIAFCVFKQVLSYWSLQFNLYLKSLAGCSTVVWRKFYESNAILDIVESGVCKMPEWKLASLNAEGVVKQHVRSFIRECKCRKLCDKDTRLLDKHHSYRPLGLLPSGVSAWTPVQWILFVTTESSQFLALKAKICAALRHVHCCVTPPYPSHGTTHFIDLQE